jgi:uncharacterized protein YggU (UPF0235/DUF167 family)
MIVSVIAHPWSKRNLVKKEQDIFGEEIYHIYTSSKPIDGEANKAIHRIALADFLQLKKYQIRLVSGETSKYKKFEMTI